MTLPEELAAYPQPGRGGSVRLGVGLHHQGRREHAPSDPCWSPAW